mgnify:CR=1 FL=1
MEKRQVPPSFKGKKHSEENKKKWSEARTGKTSPFKGMHHTEEAKKKLHEAFIGIKMIKIHHFHEPKHKSIQIRLDLRRWQGAAFGQSMESTS